MQIVLEKEVCQSGFDPQAENHCSKAATQPSPFFSSVHHRALITRQSCRLTPHIAASHCISFDTQSFHSEHALRINNMKRLNLFLFPLSNRFLEALCFGLLQCRLSGVYFSISYFFLFEKLG